jgi:hypothetical protein
MFKKKYFILNRSYRNKYDSSYLFVLYGLIILLGCQKEIKIDFPKYTPKIVVNCFFNPDSTWKVHISSSIPINGKENPPLITNAKVELYEDNIFVSNLKLSNKGYYISSLKPIVNRRYTLKVNAPDFESVECSDKIDSTTTSFTTKFDTTETFITVKNLTYSENIPVSTLQLIIKDDPNINNYYELRGRYARSQSTPSKEENTIFHSFFPSIETFSRYQKLVLFNDSLFAGIEKTLMLYLDNHQTFITTHLPNGNMGVLWKAVDNLYFDFKTVSQSYFLYQKTFLLQKYNHKNPFSETTKVYSNVKNGLGIFAGYQCKSVKLYK